jgi:Uma2 family endonuclease
MKYRTGGGAMTVREFEQMPEDGYRHELVVGSVLREPLPGAEHAWIARNLFRPLDEHVSAARAGVVLMDVGFRLAEDPPTVRGPDLAFIASAKLPADAPPRGFWPFAPDLAIEVASPRDRWSVMRDKVQDYLAAGTRAVWVVEPGARRITVFGGSRDVRFLHEGEVLEGDAVLPGFQLPVSDVFRR